MSCKFQYLKLNISKISRTFAGGKIFIVLGLVKTIRESLTFVNKGDMKFTNRWRNPLETCVGAMLSTFYNGKSHSKRGG